MSGRIDCGEKQSRRRAKEDMAADLAKSGIPRARAEAIARRCAVRADKGMVGNDHGRAPVRRKDDR